MVGRPDVKIFRSVDTYPIKGVDVSHFSDDVDLFKLRAADIRFVNAKATQGAHLYDPKYTKYAAEAASAGIPFGAYHFFETCVSPWEQFQNLQSKVPNDADLLPISVVVEWEVKPGAPMSIIRPCAEAKNNLESFLKLIQSHYGKIPIVYTASTFIREYGIVDETFNRYPLWIADFSRRSIRAGKPSLPGTNPWTLWQTTDSARIPGISRPVDLNVFFGSEAEFQEFRNGKGNPALIAALRKPAP